MAAKFVPMRLAADDILFDFLKTRINFDPC